MFDKNNEDYKIVLNLTPLEYQLATEYQCNYQRLFDKSLSLEVLFKTALFFSNNINNQKLAILNSYEKTATKRLSNKDQSHNIPKKNTKKSHSKKRVIPQKESAGHQASLGGVFEWLLFLIK